MLSLNTPVIAIVGPTASGKTEVAQRLALGLGGEIISADSMQVYCGMDIGTGKLPLMDRKVPHHGFDLVNPGDAYSAALYQDYARKCIVAIDRRGKQPILCGGTGLYIKAVIDDYCFPAGEQVNNSIRERYESYGKAHGNAALWALLNDRDPASAEVLHPNNVRRVVRALELWEEGKSYAEQKNGLSTIQPFLPSVQFGLAVDPEILNGNINRRVDYMIQQGLVDEVKHLLDKGFREGITAPQAIGYKEIVDAIDGHSTVSDAIDSIKKATRHYGKRQRTWFRKDKRIRWIDANDGDIKRITDDILSQLETLGFYDGHAA